MDIKKGALHVESLQADNQVSAPGLNKPAAKDFMGQRVKCEYTLVWEMATNSLQSPHYEAKSTEDVERREPLCTVRGNVNWCSHDAKQYGGPSKKLKNGATI